MLRLCIVAFMGSARAHGAEHAKEASFTMALPLLILAVVAIISGYGFIANDLVPFNGFHAHGFALGLPFYMSMGSLAIGILLALAIYGFGKDPGLAHELKSGRKLFGPDNIALADKAKPAVVALGTENCGCALHVAAAVFYYFRGLLDFNYGRVSCYGGLGLAVCQREGLQTHGRGQCKYQQHYKLLQHYEGGF
jgi:NADH:ubiquinone oxidoreductase subunit 5 (subunit L)/multisubunit Na+/H+ antiporter MnhA subunit